MAERVRIVEICPPGYRGNDRQHLHLGCAPLQDTITCNIFVQIGLAYIYINGKISRSDESSRIVGSFHLYLSNKMGKQLVIHT
jgi:hypothetical protein